MLALTLYVGVFREPGSRPPAECGRTAAALHSKLPPLNMARITELEAVARLAGQGLLDDLARFDSPVSSPELSRRRRIADFIARNYRGRIGLGDLARHLHLSPSRASHCVRSCFGKPFQELLIQERMERARLMLLAGDFTLDETAAACGVEDTHYFNRLFRRTFGTPPGKFRDKFAEKIEI
jgi:AraC-like DNA-binding protein